MPLVVVPLELPPHVRSVRFGEVDDDGRDELIFVSHPPGGSRPDGTVLTVVHFDAQGREEGRQRLDLGTRAAWFDVQDGILGLTAEGPTAWTLTGETRLLRERPTVLALLGPTTPEEADVAVDLDGDGVAEVLHASGRRLEATQADGSSWTGSVPLDLRGDLGSGDKAGGKSLLATVAMPPVVVVGDVDGDGLKDLVLPRRDEATAWLSGPGQLGRAQVRLKLPLDLDPPEEPGRAGSKETRRELEQAWFEDVDQDGKLDLIVHQWVLDGSWFGATAEITFARGTGAGFERPQLLRTTAAAVDLQRVDFDGDGDLDLLVPQVDVGLGQLGRALLSRTIKVDVWLYVLGEDGRYGIEPVSLGRITVPVEDSEQHQLELAEDMTGDGVMDFVTNEGEAGVLRIFPGFLHGVPEEAAGEVSLTLPHGEDVLASHDLTGDRRAELVVWGPDAATGYVVRWID